MLFLARYAGHHISLSTTTACLCSPWLLHEFHQCHITSLAGASILRVNAAFRLPRSAGRGTHLGCILSLLRFPSSLVVPSVVLSPAVIVPKYSLVSPSSPPSSPSLFPLVVLVLRSDFWHGQLVFVWQWNFISSPLKLSQRVVPVFSPSHYHLLSPLVRTPSCHSHRHLLGLRSLVYIPGPHLITPHLLITPSSSPISRERGLRLTKRQKPR
jgi:hypothetical protein